MLKACTLFKRKPGMALEAFQEYWRTGHAEVVCGLPDIRRYVQSHPLLGGYRKGELIYDGVAEIWVDDTEALRRMSAAPAYRAVQADEEKFIDRASMALLLTEEHVIKDGPVPDGGGLKNIEFVTRQADLPVADFQAYWRGTHGPIAAQIPMIRRYVQSHTKLSGYGREIPPAYDGLAITWFDDIDAMRQSAKTEAFAATMADEPNFLPGGPVPTIITREHIIVA
jgi:uncharacterized protein (TIGR02118 family)